MFKQNKSPVLILGCIVFIMMVFLPDTFVMAADQTTGETVSSTLLTFAKLLSWVWIFFAMLAGKLMTNDFVYGSIFNLDKYLWMLWNMMKNFANYVIGFAFVFLVLKSFFDPKEGTAKIRKVLPAFLISSVMVQASWFVMGALIDVSTIMTAAVGSLPATFIQESGLTADMLKTISIPKCTDKGDVNNSTKEYRVCSDDPAKTIDAMLPKYNSLSGPLYYMGFSILSLQDYTKISSTQKDPGQISTAVLLQVILVILFVVPIILLVVVNIIRIFRIRIWVAMSPFLVLDAFLFKEAFNKNIISSQNKGFKISNVIGLIFQPVAVVATMGIAVIIVASISSALMGKDVPLIKDNIKCTTNQSTCTLKFLKDDDKGTSPGITFDGDFLDRSKKMAGGAMGYLIMCMITIFMLWGILKVGFHTNELTKGIADSTFNLIGSLAKATPILPGGFTIGNVAAIPGQLQASSNTLAGNQAAKTTEFINEMMGISKESNITEQEVSAVINKNPGGSPDQVKNTFDGFRALLNSKKDVSYDPQVTRLLRTWLNSNQGKDYWKHNYQIIGDSSAVDASGIKDVEKLIKNDNFSRFVYGTLKEGKNDFANPTTIVTDYNYTNYNYSKLYSDVKFGKSK